jgi:hypothetical protein
MAVVSGRRPKAISVSKQAVDQAGSLLQQLPDKPKENLSLRDAIDQLQEEIKDALSKGYTYIDVAVLLADKGIVISPATLKRYVSMGRGKAKARKSGATTGAKRPRKTQSAPMEVADEEEDAFFDPSEPDEAPVAKRGRRSSAAEAQAEVPQAQTTGRRTRSSAAKPASTPRSTSGRGRKKAAE